MNEWGFRLDNVTASWSNKGRNILENIYFDFRVRDGHTAMLPLMGPSGQGKSTLLYLLATLKLPTAGTVTWDFPDGSSHVWSHQPMDVVNTVQLRQRDFGFAFQDSTLSPHLTIIENIAYPLLLQGKKWQEALLTAEEKFAEVLLFSEKKDNEQMTLMHHFPAQLSGGQRQRAALAQAIVHNPRVLFADEPTGQLDLHTRKQVMDVLKRWVIEGQGQRCLIWVTHHHVDDLKLMEVDNLLFIENRRCTLQNRAWLEDWINLKQ